VSWSALNSSGAGFQRRGDRRAMASLARIEVGARLRARRSRRSVFCLVAVVTLMLMDDAGAAVMRADISRAVPHKAFASHGFRADEVDEADAAMAGGGTPHTPDVAGRLPACSGSYPLHQRCVRRASGGIKTKLRQSVGWCGGCRSVAAAPPDLPSCVVSSRPRYGAPPGLAGDLPPHGTRRRWGGRPHAWL
jgi:hypothetical protein